MIRFNPQVFFSRSQVLRREKVTLTVMFFLTSFYLSSPILLFSFPFSYLAKVQVHKRREQEKKFINAGPVMNRHQLIEGAIDELTKFLLLFSLSSFQVPITAIFGWWYTLFRKEEDEQHKDWSWVTFILAMMGGWKKSRPKRWIGSSVLLTPILSLFSHFLSSFDERDETVFRLKFVRVKLQKSNFNSKLSLHLSLLSLSLELGWDG